MVTPLSVIQFAQKLEKHPDKAFVPYILSGLKHGFKLGFRVPRRLKSAVRNKPSAFQHPRVIVEYLANDVRLGRVAGPFPQHPLVNLRGNPQKRATRQTETHRRFVISSRCERQWRHWPRKLYSSIYSTGRDYQYGGQVWLRCLDGQVRCWSSLSQHSSTAWRPLPFGFKVCVCVCVWGGGLFCWPHAPFWLEIGSYIFNSVASAVEWILIKNYTRWGNWFIISTILVGPPNS